MRSAPEPITEVQYDENRDKLVVRFGDGHGLVYVGVPGEVGRSFIDAESRQGYFDAEIADRYPYNRLDS